MIGHFKADGVIDLTRQACHTYNVEAYRIDEMLQETFGLPTLHLETDYSENDTEQLWVALKPIWKCFEKASKFQIFSQEVIVNSYLPYQESTCKDAVW